ncbi:YcnI family protein [Myceligenerans pegani]|uniref:YcnI family protein n=1 Tax=Myceligenerans pegani TaxID=2776917 RepID=A0ABR9MWA2_9MICO|nr:YcnI family protein [Myceligenerans sp. TRM 65318]MBE1875658.1 YcnI family protein [Myceligenerans sp. TRM 65318]MBE3017929.1 YcnI family protein [Myceligenerans sp. TRM 65318]
MRKTLRALGATTLAAGLVVAGTTTASAHVGVTPSTTAAGAYSLLTFGVPHGCDGSATETVSIQMPEQIITVTPSVNPNWDVEKVMEELDEPIDDGHGGEYTERVAEVVYTAKTPLPDDLRDAFELSLKLPEAVGETLVFPAVQECEEGETAWVQVPEEGESADGLDYPAPSFVLTAAEGDGHGDATSDDMSEDEAGAENVAASSEAGTSGASGAAAGTPALTWVALVLGAGGLVLGLLAFLRSRAQS